MHSQCRDIGPEWSQILPYLVTLLLHTENWKQNFTKREKNQWNFNYSPVHSGTMVNHKKHTQVCSNAFWTRLPVVILMFKIIWCCYFLLFSSSFQLLHSGIDGRSVPAACSDRACLHRTGFVAGARFRNPDWISVQWIWLSDIKTNKIK